MPSKIVPPAAEPRRKTADLRLGRESFSGAVYFITFCTAERVPKLMAPEVLAETVVASRAMLSNQDAEILAATVMPDHVHLLLRLGSRLALDRVISKWRATVRRRCRGVAWQANFFEHRVRREEALEKYAWYVFMNPYRANLIPVDQSWPGWWRETGVKWEFLELARPGPCPQPEWLGTHDEQVRELVTGE